jgi:4-amino-4-deoxy-L-arabinose transferase-like glycosyltransferase
MSCKSGCRLRMTDPAAPRRWTLILLLLLLIAVWFGTLNVRALIRPDEGRYAEIPREMAATGDWITPRLNGIKYFEKPPLQYWATAAAYKLFGEHPWTARLWPALTGMLCLLLVFFAGRELFGGTVAFYAALILAGSPGFIMVSQMNTLDMGLTLFMTATLMFFLLALRDDAHPRSPWMLAAWASAALAVLSKGLVGIVLPGGVLAAYVLVQRDWQLLGRLRWGWGLAIFLAITAPWFVLVQRANAEFFGFFFIHEHFSRFAGETHRRTGAWWYFLPVLAFAMLPWLLNLPHALLRGWRDAPARGTWQPRRFLTLWVVLIFVFFSLSGSKLQSYILPILPALALLLAHGIVATAPRALLATALTLAAAAAAILIYAPTITSHASASTPADLYAQYVPWLLAAGAAGLTFALIAAWAAVRGKRDATMISISAGMLFTTLIAALGHNTLAPSFSARDLAQQIQPHLAADTPFYSVLDYDQALPFYTKRTMTLVGFADEMSFGLQQEPHLWLKDLPAFIEAWHGQPRALAIMQPATYAKLKNDGLPMHIVGRDFRRIVVKRPAAAANP